MFITTHMLLLMAAACAKPAGWQIKKWIDESKKK